MKSLLLVSLKFLLTECSILAQRVSLSHSFANASFNQDLSVLTFEDLDDLTVGYQIFATLDLAPRQLRCTNPGYLLCADGATCCPAGYDCVSNGCCPSGQRPCGSSICYNPITQKCCADGISACARNMDCVPNGCCPSGEQLCGQSRCYNPARQNCCLKSGRVWGCSIPSSCCDTPGVCYAAGEQCCENGSCPLGDTCCRNECCKPIATCGANGFCSRKATPRPTSTPSPSSTRKPSLTAYSTPKFSTPKVSSSSTADNCAPSGVSNDVVSDTSDSGEYIRVDGECLPVMDFVYVDGLTEQLIESMCAGIQSQNWPGRISNSMMVLTKRGYRKQTPNCPGPCRGRIDPRYNERMQCDEFPFGSTTEGGDSNAHTMCIVWWQNSIQSTLIRQYNVFYNIQANDRFVVRISPNCDTVLSPGGSTKRLVRDLLERRQSELPSNQTIGNETILTSSYNKWVQDAIPGAPNGTGNIFVPFGGVNPGLFNTQINLQGSVDEIFVIGGDGMEYSSMKVPLASETMNFTVPESDDLSIVVPALYNASVNVSYTATMSALPANVTAESGSSHVYDDWMRTISTLYVAGGILVIMTLCCELKLE